MLRRRLARHSFSCGVAGADSAGRRQGHSSSRSFSASRGCLHAHLWSTEVVQRIVGSSCAELVEAPVTAAREDLRGYFVAAWCVHPDLVPEEEIIVLPEPPAPFAGGGPLFLREHEIIPHPALPCRDQDRRPP